MKFDYSNNIIIPGSLQLNDVEKAQIPHYKNPGTSPKQQLALIIGNNFFALVLKTPMLIQVYIPIICCKLNWWYHTAIDGSFENTE
jgi:hypothetical protein